MSNLYDDEALIAATTEAITAYKKRHGITGHTYFWQGAEEETRVLLDAVAPLIAAKALRDAGSEMRIGWGDLLLPDGSVFRGAQHHPDDGSRAIPLYQWLADRADEIERGE
jgi:hypothetical protein